MYRYIPALTMTDFPFPSSARNSVTLCLRLGFTDPLTVGIALLNSIPVIETKTILKHKIKKIKQTSNLLLPLIKTCLASSKVKDS